MDAKTLAYTEESFKINESACAWTLRALSLLRSQLRLKIRLHHHPGQIESAQVFLFNHFARFETFIPQYLIHQETGAYSRSVASKEFFVPGNAFSNYLLGVGAVPNNYPHLLPFLATEILRGRKVVIFPEGGMVKDRRVVDRDGGFSIFSRSAKERRKHHTGAAVLALTLEAFKEGLRAIAKSGNTDCIERWASTLGIERDALMAEVQRPTQVVPSNITFYPLGIGENVLQRTASFFNGKLPKQLAEELMIEGNILLKDTDMDIRLGNPIEPAISWRWWERKLLGMIVRRVTSIDELFRRTPELDALSNRLLAMCIGSRVLGARDSYMKEMYGNVTVNMSHLASRLIMMLIGRKMFEIDARRFHRILYLAIKRAQSEPTIKLHRSLVNPDFYRGLLDEECAGLRTLITAAGQLGLIAHDGNSYKFLPKLCEEFDFDVIRMENPIAVYANEVAPISCVQTALNDKLGAIDTMDEKAWARERFSDMLVELAWQKQLYVKGRYTEINAQETATESPEPYLYLSYGHRPLGVVLVHGFLARPSELGAFGKRLAAEGYPVIGVRLNGHGTSPWDLRNRTWQNWMEPVREGYRIMSAFADRIAVIGFSSGGALSLILASDGPDNLAGVAAVATPLKFRNRNLIFVPLVHGANALTRWVPNFEGVMPFRVNDSEHPETNYRNIAIRGLFEVRRMVETMNDGLPRVRCPVALFQGDEDQVVDPQSADLILRRLGSNRKSIEMIPSKRHGIFREDIGGTCDKVLAFVESLSVHG